MFKFLDLTKAFDCVSNDILLYKLQEYNVNSNSLQLIKSYLSDRVNHNNLNSQILSVNSGVLQGSILGLLLFIIFVNDLPSTSLANMIMCADDTTLIHDSKYINCLDRTVIDEEAVKVTEWFIAYELQINSTLCRKMLFTLRSHVFNVATVTRTKFLGVLVDNKLSWSDYCKQLSEIFLT